MSDIRPHWDPRTGPGVVTPPAAEEGAFSLNTPNVPTRIPREFGRYRILNCLGRGGMGAVFRAHDTQLDRIVALKVPFLGNDDAGTRERFFREARSAAALHHANICPVFDVGELFSIPYLTMAFVEGPTLASALETGRRFTPQQSALLVRKLALAMQEAHNRGVIHRDLKPGNVLLRSDGEPVLTDFGLARRGNDQSEGLTQQGDVIGTIEYMSPEQFEGDNVAVGPASDVYALGVILYELLTGRRPFAGATASKMAAILLKPTPRPGEVRPDLPTQMDEICLKAMAKNPADRYASMTEFAVALAAFVRAQLPGGAPVASQDVAARPTPPPSANTQPIREKPALKPASKPVLKPAATTRDPGWEVVEPPAGTPPPTQPLIRAKLVKPRKKKEKIESVSNRPILFGAVALAVACASLIIAAIIMRV